VVQTCVDSKTDTVAVRVESPLWRDGRLQMMLDFPAPAQNVGARLGDFSRAASHQTIMIRQTQDQIELNRSIDDTHYEVVLNGRGFTVSQSGCILRSLDSGECIRH
jgi:alpha-galactosidase